MARPDFLKQILGLDSYSPRAQLSLLAYYLRRTGQSEFTPAEIEAAFLDSAIPLPTPSLADALRDASTGRRSPLVPLGGGALSLSADGLEEVEALLRQIGGLRSALEAVQALVGAVAPEADDKFLPEVRECIEGGARRAVVVMMWLLTVDHLERYVMTHALAAFNSGLASRSEYRTMPAIRRQDDFGELRKEHHFIEILASSRIISHDVKKLLEERLGFRNTCAHPNAVLVSDAKLVSFVEDLAYNVILKLPL